jgi:hypothetical protein
LKGPRPDLTMTGRCRSYSSARSAKIKIRTSSRHIAKLVLCLDEVRILIFDDPAELYEQQHPEFCFTQLDSTHWLYTSNCRSTHAAIGIEHCVPTKFIKHYACETLQLSDFEP